VVSTYEICISEVDDVVLCTPTAECCDDVVFLFQSLHIEDIFHFTQDGEERVKLLFLTLALISFVNHVNAKIVVLIKGLAPRWGRQSSGGTSSSNLLDDVASSRKIESLLFRSKELFHIHNGVLSAGEAWRRVDGRWRWRRRAASGAVSLTLVALGFADHRGERLSLFSIQLEGKISGDHW
jgi:hypothetical protein